MATMERQPDGTILITLGAGETISTLHEGFWFEGSRYFWNAIKGWWEREYVDARGLRRREVVDYLRFLPFTSVGTGLTGSFAIPSAVGGVPVPLWPMPFDDPIAYSHHVAARRWLRVVAYIDRDNTSLEIPLLDDDDKPWLDPGLPALMVVRKHQSTTDRVTNPGASNIRWDDTYINVVPSTILPTANLTFGTADLLWVAQKPRRDPVPHMVLEIMNASPTTSSQQVNVMIDLLSNGYGTHSSSSREEGSASTSGHWKATLQWSDVAFNTSGFDRTELNERLYAKGAIHVANSLPAASSTPGTLYLTTGANQGTSSGTALFSDLPMLQVQGHSDLNTDVTASAETTWKPETWGMGCLTATSQALSQSGAFKNYYSELYLDSTSGHYAVDVYNTGDDGGGVSSSSRDRTFFAFCVGK